jgi:hypothetical protein
MQVNEFVLLLVRCFVLDWHFLLVDIYLATVIERSIFMSLEYGAGCRASPWQFAIYDV